MKVFVAGATGFIGSATCRALVAAGHEVRGLARSEEKARDLRCDGAIPIVGSLDRPDSFIGEAGRPDAVVHLAATWFSGRETVGEARSIGERILGWTRALATLALESRSRILVFCGSNARHGEHGAHPGGPGPGRIGGSREAVGYDRILEPAQTYLETQMSELPVTVLLPGWVYGPGSWFPELVREIREGRTSHLVDEGGARLGYVHVEDVGQAFRLAVEKGEAGGRYNVLDEDPLTARQFVVETARAMGAPVPRGVSRAQAIAARGEVYAEALTCSVDLDIRPTRRELGWRLRYASARDGIPAALRSLDPRA